MNYLYLLVDAATISIPFIYTFDKRLNFHHQWKNFFPACLITGLFFIVWDVFFTQWGIWGFNEVYLTGINLINLPIEEWLFFLCIPYACLFTYHSLFYLISNPFKFPSKYISIPLIVILGILLFLNFGKYYTTSAFVYCIGSVITAEYLIKAEYLNRFYFTYLIILIPFFIVNGILTGSWIEDQVVWYNDTENLGFRIGTIPFEDIFYGMGLLLTITMIYEFLQKRKTQILA